jgi:thiamine-phosphate pyrophosphorylase
MGMSSSERETSFSWRVRWLAASRLYLVTPARPDLAELIEAAIAGGVDMVQVREKDMSDRDLLPVLARAREVTRQHDVPFVVNDRVDLASIVGADFVHVGQDDMPPDMAKRFGVGVGLSTHAAEDIDGAPADADYIGVGPVFATPTKPGRPAVGLELVRYAAQAAKLPWFAIGGIDETNVAEVVAAGAERIAVVRAIADADDPERAARALKSALG